MKTTINILIIWVLVGVGIFCGKVEAGPKISKSEVKIEKAFVPEGFKFQIITIDSCEYIARSIGGNTGLLTHKGNCKNPIHYK